MTPSPNNKNKYDEEQPIMSSSYQNENTSLLPTTAPSRSSSNVDSETNSSEGDDQFPSLDERRDSFSHMKKVVHNDPTLSKEYESAEDFQKLLGSTTLLKNSIEQDLPTQADFLNRRQHRSSSYGMILESDREADFEDVSALTFGRESMTRNSVRNSVNFLSKRQSFNGLSEREQSIRDSLRPKNDNYFVFTEMRKLYASQVSQPSTLYLRKIKNNFFSDAKSLAAGTIPQSIVLAIVIGIVCGIACYVYYSVLFFGLDYIWDVLPEEYVIPNWKPENYWLWIPLVNVLMTLCVGLTVIYMGEPGDLPYTISRVHTEAYIPMNHVMPMVFASIFSILAGGSLGPEAPLVAICGALGGFVSRRIFRQSSTNVVRKHTLMGMAGALAAFFGVPLGGSLFALEVCSRFGIEYFEHLIESIFCGEICLMVFRGLSGLPIKPIWNLTSAMHPRITECKPIEVFMGAFIGLYGALLAYCFASFHWKNMAFFGKLNLLDNSRAIYRAWLGAFFIVLMALLVPHSAFWGEEEIQVVANMGMAKDLPNIWPTTGLTGFEIDSPSHIFLMGCAKLVAVSFTVAGGLRGGFIFPLMCAGCAFGRFLYFFCPETVPMQIVVLCTAAAMNTAITRTTLATTLILAFLPGEPVAIPPLLMSSLCSLFATSYMPFIKSQITRSDIDHSLFHEEHQIDVDSVFSDATDMDDYLSD